MFVVAGGATIDACTGTCFLPMIHNVLLINRQGKVLVTKYFDGTSREEQLDFECLLGGASRDGTRAHRCAGAQPPTRSRLLTLPFALDGHGRNAPLCPQR